MDGITFGNQMNKNQARATAKATRKVLKWLTDGSTVPAATQLIADLGGSEVATITAAEVECTSNLPGCAPIETVVTVLCEGQNVMAKVNKSIADVTVAELKAMIDEIRSCTVADDAVGDSAGKWENGAAAGQYKYLMLPGAHTGAQDSDSAQAGENGGGASDGGDLLQAMSEVDRAQQRKHLVSTAVRPGDLYQALSVTGASAGDSAIPKSKPGKGSTLSPPKPTPTPSPLPPPSSSTRPSWTQPSRPPPPPQTPPPPPPTPPTPPTSRGASFATGLLVGLGGVAVVLAADAALSKGGKGGSGKGSGTTSSISSGRSAGGGGPFGVGKGASAGAAVTVGCETQRNVFYTMASGVGVVMLLAMARTRSVGGGLWVYWDKSIFGRGSHGNGNKHSGDEKAKGKGRKVASSNRRVRLPPELRMPRGCPCCSREFRGLNM